MRKFLFLFGCILFTNTSQAELDKKCYPMLGIMESPYEIEDYSFDKQKYLIDNCISNTENKIETLEWALVSPYYRTGTYRKTFKDWEIYQIKQSSNELLNISSRESISVLIHYSSDIFVSEREYLFIKQLFTTALEKNPYETIIALRQIYKKDIFFHDKNVEKILKKIYQEAMNKY